MNKVFITIGSFSIYWYSLLIIIALLLGINIADRYSKKMRLPGTLIMDMLLGLVFSAIIGARLYYVLFNYAEYKDNMIEIFMVWKGGLAIYGAIIAGIIYILNYCIKKKVSFITILDICSLSLLLGQAIGRWGNFFNSEAYGGITTKEALQTLHIPEFIINGMYIEGNYRTPTFLYESLWCLIGAVILFFIRKKKNYIKGRQISFYLFWYGIGRFFIENLRSDSLYIGEYKVSMIVSLIFIVIGFIGLAITFIKRKKANNFAKVGTTTTTHGRI